MKTKVESSAEPAVHHLFLSFIINHSPDRLGYPGGKIGRTEKKNRVTDVGDVDGVRIYNAYM